MIKEKYSYECKEWIKENIANYKSYSDLAKAVSEKFNIETKRSQMSDLCTKRLKIKIQYNAGRFRTGIHVKQHMPLLSETFIDGYWWIKVDNKSDRNISRTKSFQINWKQKQRYIYEQYYGKIKEGNVIVFLDGNVNNFDIKNLYSVPQAIHATMCRRKWYGYGEISKAGIENTIAERQLKKEKENE